MTKDYKTRIKADELADYVVMPCDIAHRVIIRIPKIEKLAANKRGTQHRVTVYNNQNEILWDCWTTPDGTGATVAQAFQYVAALALRIWEPK